MNDKVKLILSVAVLSGVFALCGVGVYRGDMSVTAALSTAMAALSSAGVFGALFGKSSG